MKNVCFIKHGHPDNRTAILRDKDKPISGEGKNAIQKLADKLASMNVLPDLILSSTAERSVMTARILSQAFDTGIETKYVDLYLAPVREYFRHLKILDDRYNSILMISHEPASTELLHQLLGFYHTLVPPSSAICLQFDTDIWSKMDHVPRKVKYLFIQGKQVDINNTQQLEKLMQGYMHNA